MDDSSEDREGLIVANAKLRKRLQTAISEGNILRREVHAWRSWREGTGSLVKVIAARRETDVSGAFRCLSDD